MWDSVTTIGVIANLVQIAGAVFVCADLLYKKIHVHSKRIEHQA
jgi:pyrrolidone-carboxylate peptidase